MHLQRLATKRALIKELLAAAPSDEAALAPPPPPAPGSAAARRASIVALFSELGKNLAKILVPEVVEEEEEGPELPFGENDTWGEEEEPVEGYHGAVSETEDEW
jgi:hypothetical protein